MRLAFLVAIVVASGCYLSHPRASEARADGGRADDDAHVDAPIVPHAASCRVRCADPVIVARYDGDSPEDELDTLLDVARVGSTVGLLAKRYLAHPSDEAPMREYVLLLVDLESGIIRETDPARAVRTSQHFGGGLIADGSSFMATVVRSETIDYGRPSSIDVGAARWTLEGELLHEGIVARFPAPLASCGCAYAGTAFGRGSVSFAVVAHDGAVDAVRLLWDDALPSGAMIAPLATLIPDTPGATPVDGVALSDDTVVLAGGGFGEGLEPRSGFVAAGALHEVPLLASPIDGAAFDAPPLVTSAPSADSFYLFHQVSDTRDLAASVLRAQLRDRDGPVDTLSIPLPGGLVPVAMASFGSPSGAGLSWVDRDGSVHLLPAMEGWDRCGHEVDPGVVATLPFGLASGRAFLAAEHEGDVLLFALDHSGERGRALVVLRIPGCEVLEEGP